MRVVWRFLGHPFTIYRFFKMSDETTFLEDILEGIDFTYDAIQTEPAHVRDGNLAARQRAAKLRARYDSTGVFDGGNFIGSSKMVINEL